MRPLSENSGANPEGPTHRCDGRQEGKTHRGESRVNQRVGLNLVQCCLVALYKSLWSLAEGFVQCILRCPVSLSVNMYGQEKATKTSMEPRS